MWMATLSFEPLQTLSTYAVERVQGYPRFRDFFSRLAAQIFAYLKAAAYSLYLSAASG